MAENSQAPHLKRHLTTTTLTLYGIGVIVGAGIYVLLGKVAGIAGNGVWLVFVASAVAALPTGLSYAELASRYPKSAGEAVFANRAFGSATLSFLVGFLILASGIASTAAISHGFANYFGELTGVSPIPCIIVFLAVIVWINHRGIEEATWINVLCTVVSVGALVLLIVLSVPQWGSVDLFDFSSVEGNSLSVGALLVSGAALAFYAYIGFEDICNVAEEVKAPQRTIPRAILLSMAVTTVIYIGIGICVVSVATPAELSASRVPLALVAERLLPAFPPYWLSVIALFAVFNSALFNMIMASRILYGMAKAGWIPQPFAKIHPVRQTPTWGVLAAGIMALIFALSGVLKVLAESTNTIILSAFFMVNLSLVVVKFRKVPPDEPEHGYFNVPMIVPMLGMIVTAVMVAQFSTGAYMRALGLLVVGVVLYALHRLKK